MSTCSLVGVAEAFEIAVSEEIAKDMAAADTVEKAQTVVTEELPLADCAMEGKFAIARSRMELEEIAQATTEEEVTTIVAEFEKTISDFDKLITAALNALKEEADSPLPALGYTAPYAFGNVFLTIWGTVLVYVI